jgi:glycosyltransferase involved in cell wall biosynthesis
MAAGPFDRILAHWALPCAYPAALAARGELEIVSHGSDVALLERMPLALRVRIVRTLVARASVWRFVSEPLLARLARSLPPGTLANAIVRPCAIEIPDVHARAEDKRREMGAPFVSTVGRLVASKRTERIVATAANERMPLVIVGDGPERPRLERAALDSRGDVRFVGRVPREEALAWMRASSALWFASCAEGLPTVLREAEALGVPVRML